MLRATAARIGFLPLLNFIFVLLVNQFALELTVFPQRRIDHVW